MPSLPTPGADLGTWATKLNEFLAVSNGPDGRLKSSYSSQEALYLDPTGAFTARSAVLAMERNLPTPVGIQATIFSVTSGKGDNTTFKGVSGAYLQSRDRTDVTAANKGVLYGMHLSVVPRVARNNVPYDDVACLVVQNDADVANAKGTDAIYIGRNAAAFTGTNKEWITGVLVDANADTAYRAAGAYVNAIDVSGATISNRALLIPNSKYIGALNAAGTTDIGILTLDSNDWVRVRSAEIIVGSNALGFLGTTPVAKQTVTGSRGANPALASVITALANYGLVTDSSTV